MATNSNMGFSQGAFPASVFDSQVFTLQPALRNGSSGVLLPVGGSSSSNGRMSSMGNSGGICNMAGLVWGDCLTSAQILDTMPVVNPDSTGMALDWSIEEQSILEEGLAKYDEEPNIMKYIKIAATLRDKTVRDVALRCRWMTKDKGKRRKLEEYCSGKRMKDRKENFVDSSFKATIPPAPQKNLASHSFMVHHMNPKDNLSCESGAARDLLDENNQVFNQIATNLSAFKFQENIELFYRSRNNITTILNDMRNMPGIMSRMSPLPVQLDEELVNTLFNSSCQVNSQELAFTTPSSFFLKREPNC